MIAMALSCEPKLLIADEPTTALDVTIQAQILKLLDDLKTRLGMAMLLITHDMGVIAGHADRVNVMYAGRIVETAETDNLFTTMNHPYTQALLASIPRLSQDANQRLLNIPGLPPDLTKPPEGCRFAARCSKVTDKCRTDEPPLTGQSGEHLFACWHPVNGPIEAANGAKTAVTVAKPRTGADDEAAPEVLPGTVLLEVRNIVKEYPITSGAILQRRAGAVHAVTDVSFTVNAGETFGLVGESGCGKTTIGKLIVALEHPTSGNVLLSGRDVSALRGNELRKYRKHLQLMFQDPYSSLDPRMRVGAIIREPLTIQKIGSRDEQNNRVYDLLDEVGLPRNAVERYPHEFSGGQRQRIGLARALTLNPQVIVADEPVSALDVSIRAQVLNLMKRLADRPRPDLRRHLPRPGRRQVHGRQDRRDVPGQARGAWLGRRHLPARCAPVHRWPDRDHPGARARGRPRPPRRRHRRRAAEPDQPAVRLPVPHQMPARSGDLLGGGTAAALVRSRPRRGMPLPAAGPC